MSPLLLAATLITRFYAVIDSFAGSLSTTILDVFKNAAGDVATCLVTAYAAGTKSLLQVHMIANQFEDLLADLLNALAAGTMSLLSAASHLTTFIATFC